MPDHLTSMLIIEASRFRPLTGLDCLGCVASGCVLLTFCMQSMVRLRVIALFSNVAVIAYGWAALLLPILVLHCILLVINSTSLVRVFRHRTRGAHQPAQANFELAIGPIVNAPPHKRRWLRESRISPPFGGLRSHESRHLVRAQSAN